MQTFDQGNEMTTTAHDVLDSVAHMIRGGWAFAYEDLTFYVAASHPNGGKQSICSAPPKWSCQIAKALNESARIAALVEAARPFAGIAVDERIPSGHLVQCRVDAEYFRALSAALRGIGR